MFEHIFSANSSVAYHNIRNNQLIVIIQHFLHFFRRKEVTQSSKLGIPFFTLHVLMILHEIVMDAYKPIEIYPYRIDCMFLVAFDDFAELKGSRETKFLGVSHEHCDVEVLDHLLVLVEGLVLDPHRLSIVIKDDQQFFQNFYLAFFAFLFLSFLVHLPCLRIFYICQAIQKFDNSFALELRRSFHMRLFGSYLRYIFLAFDGSLCSEALDSLEEFIYL